MNRNRIIRPVVTLAAAALAVALGTTGLAVAGVDLPDPAAEAFENAGITLPNQAGGGESGDHARSEAVHTVIEGTQPSDRGCAFGHSVAEAAKGSELPDQAKDACDRADENSEKAKAESESSSHSEFGHETAERAKGQEDATVDQRKSFGQDTADQAKELGGAPDSAEQRGGAPDTDDTGAPEGTPSGPPEGTPNGPDTAPIPADTPNGPPEGTPSGRP